MKEDFTKMIVWRCNKCGELVDNPSLHKVCRQVKDKDNKPNWDSISKIYKYIAQDEDGTWCCFKEKPCTHWLKWDILNQPTMNYFKEISIGKPNSNWRETLEERPNN